MKRRRLLATAPVTCSFCKQARACRVVVKSARYGGRTVCDTCWPTLTPDRTDDGALTEADRQTWGRL